MVHRGTGTSDRPRKIKLIAVATATAVVGVTVAAVLTANASRQHTDSGGLRHSLEAEDEVDTRPNPSATDGTPSPSATPTPSPTPVAGNAMWIGADANVPRNDLPAFATANAAIGPLRYRRCFDTILPASFAQSCAAGDAAAGYHSFVSWKPPGLDAAGAAAGKYDAQITAWAQSVPLSIGLYATVWHEPENDMYGATYAAMFNHVYAVVKAANPSIMFGPVHMDYSWDPSSTRYAPGGEASWVVKQADFIAVDDYRAKPGLMSTDRQWLGWLRFANANYPTTPLVIAEWGDYAVPPGGTADPKQQAIRARDIPQDEAYLLGMHRFSMWLAWYATGAQGDWRELDTASRDAWRAVASHGRTG